MSKPQPDVEKVYGPMAAKLVAAHVHMARDHATLIAHARAHGIEFPAATVALLMVSIEALAAMSPLLDTGEAAAHELVTKTFEAAKAARMRRADA